MYIIKRTENKKLSMWDKAWESANVAGVDKVNWQKFDYVPNTTAKILYNDDGIYVQMQTDEADLFASRTKQNSDISNDSCMEFFFRPNENDNRYLNFEFNPFAAMYLACRTDRYDPVHPDADKNFFDAQTYVEEGKWILQYFIPFSFIDGIFGSHTKKMYGNLFKCGVDTKIVHYATYAPINTPEPDFHRPECFVEFVLE